VSDIVAFVADFELGTRIASTAASHGGNVIFVESPENLPGSADMLIIDLNRDEDEWMFMLNTVQRQFPQATIVGYSERVMKSLHAKAKEAGCMWVFPQSSLIKNLPQLLEKES
jgi:hypothetical protein|tara:strand:+ start:390 stop:728 length:339 start_codon:yes stop_codon:yes gene_type:complete